MLGQVLQNQQMMMCGMAGMMTGGIRREQDVMSSCLQNPAALNGLFGGAGSPGQFLAMAERVVVRMS